MTDLQTEHHRGSRQAGVAPLGAPILSKIGIDPKTLRFIKPVRKRSQYRAVVNWLTRYEPRPGAPNVDLVRGYLEAFYQLCQAEAWDKAKTIILMPLNTPNKDDLGTQLGVWGYHQEQAQLYGELLNKLDGRTDALCLRGLGNANHFLNDFGAARKYYEDSRRLYQKHGELVQAAWLWHDLGLLEADQGEDRKARAYYEKALKQFREIRNLRGIASVLNDLARVETNQGCYAKARRYYEESLDTHVHLLGMEDEKGCAWVHYNFGRFLSGQEEYVEARKYTKEGLKLFRKMGYGLGIAWSLYSLGILMLNVGKQVAACVCVKKALELFRGQENRGGIAWARHILGRIALRNEDYALASEYYREKLRMHQYEKNKTGIAFALEGFAHIAIAQNHTERGIRLFGAAEALRERIEFPLPRHDRIERERRLDSARAHVDEATFPRMWDFGQARSMEQAITEAVDEDSY